MAAAGSSSYVHYQQKIDTLRLLSDQLDQLEENKWVVLIDHLVSVVPSHLRSTGTGPIVAWAVGAWQPVFASNRSFLLYSFPTRKPEATEALFGTVLSLSDIERDFNAIANTVAFSRNTNIIRFMLSKGLNPHLTGWCYEQEETLTSIATSNSQVFSLWRTELAISGTNFEDFVREEMRLPPLAEAGWTENSLLTLFKREPTVQAADLISCSTCYITTSQFLEPAWRIELDKIRKNRGMLAPTANSLLCSLILLTHFWCS